MYPRFSLAALAVASLFTLPAIGAESTDEAVIVVTATRLATKDTEATFATEIHSRQQIEQSAAATLFDYFAQQTSVQIAPSFGNKHTPKIDMRGYGIGDGFQNIVVSIDGIRQNNIDLSTPLIGSIPLADIERIEITKGSGSVLFGDGAAAGTIQIFTRKHTGGKIDVSAGNYGAFNSTATAGLKKERFALDASASRSNFDGYSAEDSTGHSDRSTADNWRIGAAVTPTEALRIKLGAGSTRIDTRYADSLTLQQFDAEPGQNNGSPYTHQKFEADHQRIGAEAWLNQSIKLSADHQREDKKSEFVGSFVADYETANTELALSYQGEQSSLLVGAQKFDGSRTDNFSTAKTSKDNLAYFAQGQHQIGALTVSAGFRQETVEYTHAAAQADHKLNAADIGLNFKFDEQLSLFANLNRAYQAPDIDRFFNFGGSFNAFIEPMRVNTLNIGVNHVGADNRLKVTAFRANLKNEIYFEPFTFTNTNIDKSHKYGVEVQDIWRAAPALTARVNYAWTQAVIDAEDGGAGAFNGKDLPGVSWHSLNLGLSYQLDARTTLNLAQAWRSSTWAADDFDNNNTQKQRAYASTDVGVQHRVKDDLELFATVENLFARSNGVWVRDDAVYPVAFTRNWRVGVRAAF